MKKTLSLLLLFGMALCAGAAPAQTTPTSIVFNWTNNYNGLPDCSATVTASCVSGATLTDTTPATPVVLSSSIAAGATSFTTPIPAFTAASRTYSLVTNYRDSTGTAQATGAATAVVTVPIPTPGAPTGFGAKTQ